MGDDGELQGDAVLIHAAGELTVLVGVQHSDLRQGNNGAIGAACVEEGVENAVEGFAGENQRRFFVGIGVVLFAAASGHKR